MDKETKRKITPEEKKQQSIHEILFETSELLERFLREKSLKKLDRTVENVSILVAKKDKIIEIHIRGYDV